MRKFIQPFFREIIILKSMSMELNTYTLRGHVQGGAEGAWAPPLFEIY